MKFLALSNFFVYLSENTTNLNMHILFFVVDKNVDILKNYTCSSRSAWLGNLWTSITPVFVVLNIYSSDGDGNASFCCLRAFSFLLMLFVNGLPLAHFLIKVFSCLCCGPTIMLLPSIYPLFFWFF